MKYLNFENEQLKNLSFVLEKEIIRSNSAGSFASTTIIGCNTRKYHGLLISPQKGLDEENHLILSSIDETIIIDEMQFKLGIRKYPDGVFIPKGHKYIDNLDLEPIPSITYKIGDLVLTKEFLLTKNNERVIIKYSVLKSSKKIKFKIEPFLAFRNIHKLSKANDNVIKKYKTIRNGIKTKMYIGYPFLNMQFSKKSEFISNPDWYYNVTYDKEFERGYEYQEDLYVPGFFDIEIEEGESVFFSAGYSEIAPNEISEKFKNELDNRIARDSFKNCLKNAAQQFILHENGKTKIIAGFPWFGVWGRDTFISLPGLTLSVGDSKTCKSVIDTVLLQEKNGLIPNMGTDSDFSYNSVDAPLWLFWSIQKYAEYTKDYIQIWKEYKEPLTRILNLYKNGTDYNIKMMDNFLICAGNSGVALTWMDAVVNGKPITPRTGYNVEINALWYNAIEFCLEVAKIADDQKFIDEWIQFPEEIKKSFNEFFIDQNFDYLADFVSPDGVKNWDLRPNQLIALSLPYSVVDLDKADTIIKVVKQHLLTTRGLRTLSPEDDKYKPFYNGNQEERDRAYHQGTVWPWLLGSFCEAYLKVYGKEGVDFVKSIYDNFEDVMIEHGVSTISEIYDGNFPHAPKGAISQAWSVAEILRIDSLIN